MGKSYIQNVNVPAYAGEQLWRPSVKENVCKLLINTICSVVNNILKYGSVSLLCMFFQHFEIKLAIWQYLVNDEDVKNAVHNVYNDHFIVY